MSDLLVSILIVNWNTRELVLECLRSLPKPGTGPSYEVVVVDNVSVDGSGDALSRETGITLIRNERNLGYAAAVNQACRRASGDFVLLLNSDVELTPTALSSLAQFLRDNPSAAAVGPLYLNVDGSPQPFHFRLPTFAMTLANGGTVAGRLPPGSKRWLRRYRMLDDDFSQPRPVPQPSASCLLLRRSFLPKDHVFDERYPIFFNDVQLARSFADRRLTLWVTPSAKVVHHSHASTRELGAAGKRQYLSSVIRMLEGNRAGHKGMALPCRSFLQNIPVWLLRRPNAIAFRPLCKALSGDVGPLPSDPSPTR